MPDLGILQINTQRARTAAKEIRQLVDEREVDIICIQEPYVRNREVQGYPVFHKKNNNRRNTRRRNNNHKSTNNSNPD
jgi:endonuclease/exonuclease/phosphatase family metal-dependent hydrolase